MIIGYCIYVVMLGEMQGKFNGYYCCFSDDGCVFQDCEFPNFKVFYSYHAARCLLGKIKKNTRGVEGQDYVLIIKALNSIKNIVSVVDVPSDRNSLTSPII